MFDNKTYPCIIVLICCLFVFANRIRITHNRCPGTFFFHVSSAYEFYTGNIIFFKSIGIDFLQISHTVVPVHLQGRKNNCTFLVEFAHSFICQFIYGILEAVIFCINQDTYIIVVCPLA